MASRGIDRRTFLRNSAFGAAGLAVVGTGGLLAACGKDDDDKGANSAGLGKLAFQLSWVKNVEFAGEYLADTNGYYTDEGFSSVTLMSGGPGVKQDAVVASGKAFIGISSPDLVATAINNAGADLVIVGAQYQKNPFCVMSLAESPIKTPQDMIGKKIGVQDVNLPVWTSFLKANKIDPSSIHVDSVQFDPSPLANKSEDGWFSFVTNEPNFLKTKGVDTATMLLNDFGYPMVSETYMVTKASVKNNRDKVKAVLRADLKGWHDSLKDPAAAPHLVVTKYGKDQKLDEAEQVLESKAQNALILTDDTKANGLFTITDELIEESIATLALAGITIKKETLFDLSVIEEVFDENPELKTSPV